MLFSPRHVIFFSLLAGASAREITFAPKQAQYRMSPPSTDDDSLPISVPDQFFGLQTFANLPYVNSLGASLTSTDVEKYDIAVLGAPFDTSVTGRPGARFGPAGIRRGSQRIQPGFAWNIYSGENTFASWAKIVDCGDVPMTVLDNTVALQQLDKAHRVVSSRSTPSAANGYASTPRILTLGGDHTTTLSALRSTFTHWGAVSVIHFDSHIDTWNPAVLGGDVSDYAGVNHGTFLHIAHEEGLILNSSIHAGIRAPYSKPGGDLRNDRRCGFEIITARDLDRLGTQGLIDQLKQRVQGNRVYISVDIDVLDPAFAPGLPVIGADVVEVAPIYDNPGENTVLVAAEVAHSLLTLMVQTPIKV
ncbi:hypothetical protein BP6252_03467 [Coleophoma cylindrospora]|uniref:Arginase family protein n=1 Tax=Coleophoma cylindrospora TaxID=1849047 RepID=A0A3D8S7R1_9HELO|nr:hypothetical protein BP6252_03467 [Coleophoma cylindrospora]